MFWFNLFSSPLLFLLFLLFVPNPILFQSIMESLLDLYLPDSVFNKVVNDFRHPEIGSLVSDRDELVVRSNVVSAVQISVWDHILGPHVVHVWPADSQFSDDASATVGRYAHMEDLGRCDEIEIPEAKFNILPDFDVMSCSSIFSGEYRGTMTGVALSLILKRKHLDRFLEIQELIDDRMKILGFCLQRVLRLGWGKGRLLFQTPLKRFLNAFESWFAASVDQVSIDQTLLWRPMPKETKDFLSLSVTSHFECCGYSVVIGGNKEEVERFLHTMAMFGPPEHLRIASMVATRFDPENECCFVPGLHYQGIFLDDADLPADADPIYPLSEHIIIEGHLPVSVTNLTTKKVFRARHVHEYRVLREDRFGSMYRSLGNPVMDSDDEIENEPTFGDTSIIRAMKSPAPMIANNVQLVSSLPLFLRADFLQRTYRQMEIRAMEIVVYIWDMKQEHHPTMFIHHDLVRSRSTDQMHGEDHDEMHTPAQVTTRQRSRTTTRKAVGGRDMLQHHSTTSSRDDAQMSPFFPNVPHIFTPGTSQASSPPPSGSEILEVVDAGIEGTIFQDMMVRRLREDLSLESEGDFLIFVTIGEMLSPGTYVEVFSDPRKVGRRMLELFEYY
eukprot:TRINITY_DN2100_c0_g1_i1.p1 TRINITY_DN2100_c0_g1~~TRINITY_DN2100_c0_g1_i1.p1  ORF type:complete len:614 (-),score=147.48 TRINITY_DN2100_c0_g1_i1:1042-2883(-)